jgi:hypothetical protein
LSARDTCAPGGVFDLSHFTLQLPTGSNGNVDSIPSSKLTGCDGWQSKEYFYMQDGALVTKVPSKSQCVHTENSQHCRTELRESSPVSWDPKAKTNILQVQLAVQKADDSKYGTVVGQIHVDGTVSKKPVAELFYAQDGTLTFGVSQVPDVSSLKYTKVGNVAVGDKFEYEIKYQGGKLSVKIGDGKEQVMDTGKLDSPKSYFKVGNYNQGESPSEIRFYKIAIQH